MRLKRHNGDEFLCGFIESGHLLWRHEACVYGINRSITLDTAGHNAQSWVYTDIQK